MKIYCKESSENDKKYYHLWMSNNFGPLFGKYKNGNGKWNKSNDVNFTKSGSES